MRCERSPSVAPRRCDLLRLRKPSARPLCSLALLAAGWLPVHAGLLEDTSEGVPGFLEDASAGWSDIDDGWLQVEGEVGVAGFIAEGEGKVGVHDDVVAKVEPDGIVPEEFHEEWNASQECKAAQWEAFLRLTGVWEGERQRFQADDAGVLTPTVSYNATTELVYDPLVPYIVRETVYYQNGFELPSDIGEEQNGWFVVNATPISIDNLTQPDQGRVRRVNSNFTYVFGYDTLAAGPPVLRFELGIRREGYEEESRRAELLYDNSEDPLKLVHITMIWEARTGEWYNRSVLEQRRMVPLGADSFLPIFYDGLPTVHQTRYSPKCDSEDFWEEDFNISPPTYKMPSQELHFWAPRLLQRNASTELGIGWERSPQWAAHKKGQYVRNVMVFKEGKLQYLVHDVIEVTNKRRMILDTFLTVTLAALLMGALIFGCVVRESTLDEDENELELPPAYGSY